MHGDLDEPKEFYEAGRTPTYMRFRMKTSTLNVAKILLLKKRNYGLHQLWAKCMDGRQAKKVNGLLGGELRDLVEATDKGMVVTRREAMRVRTNYHGNYGEGVRFKMCHFFSAANCRDEGECPLLHMTNEADLGREEIFTDF